MASKRSAAGFGAFCSSHKPSHPSHGRIRYGGQPAAYAVNENHMGMGGKRGDHHKGKRRKA
jgi:hypothetical protein